MNILQVVYLAVIAVNVPLWIAVAYKFYRKKKRESEE